MALSLAVLLAAACASTSKLNLQPWEIAHRVESQILVGMSPREVRCILGEPTLRRWRVEREPISERHGLYSQCWYWSRDATVCFSQDPPYEVVYKHATWDSTPR